MNDLIGRNTSEPVSGAVEETAEIANIQAKMILARNFPRDPERCGQEIAAECRNLALATSAVYEYKRGDTVVKGPSIRLAECVARHWGNVISGIKEISTHGKKSTVRAYCWDLETNFADEKVFDVELVRHTKNNGTYDLTDPRDRYEMMANQAARRKRACIQAVIPQYVFDAAIEQCQATVEASIKKDELPERRKKMLDMFSQLADWITKEDISSKCGKEFDSLSARDLVKLSALYNAIKDGFVKATDAFGKVDSVAVASEKDAKDLDEINGEFGGISDDATNG